MPNKTDILISSSSFDTENNAGIDLIRAAGLQVATNPFGRKLTEAEIDTLLEDSVVGLLAGVEPLTAAVMKNAAGLKVISRLGVGLDSVDLDAAKTQGLPVYSTPDAPVDAVAEMTLGLMLACLRQITTTDRLLRGGEWSRQKGHLLKAQTVGLLGLGRIGSRVAELCRAFGASVIAHDPQVTAAPHGVKLVSFDALLAGADILSLHAPSTAATRHIINARSLAAMQHHAILINTARGSLVDELALLEALQQGQLGGAGLDVFETEPYSGPLTDIPQIVLTPHLASSALESRIQMEYEAAMNLYTGLCEAGVISASEQK